MEVPQVKYERLRKFIEEKGRGGAVIAFSGGVDSTTLAAISYSILGDRAVVATATSPTYPTEEMEDAKRIAKEIGIKHYIVETHEFENEDFVRNPEDRCYYCKKELLERLEDLAAELKFGAIFEGTNFSDLSGHRPGFRAIREGRNVFSPWAETGFTKEEIRELARKMSLSVHDKPSLACLASRIPFGEPLTEQRLGRIEKAERIVRKISGVRQLRVRDHNGLARIEVGKEERSLFFDIGVIDEIAREMRLLGFQFVTIDLEGYKTGSMISLVNGGVP